MNAKRKVFALVVSFCFLISFAGLLLGQDATKVDAKHYKVVFENDQVRVLRITYGPGEKSVMHEHAKGVAVFLTEHNVRFMMPDGSTEVVTGEAGDVIWADAVKHLPENIGDEPLEVILVEIKGN